MSWLGDIDAAVARFDEDPMLRMMVEVSARWGFRPSRVIDEWTEDDLTKAVALVVWERKKDKETCHFCGTPPQEWIDERGRVKNPPPYETYWETCHGCAAKQRAKNEHGDDADPATTVHLRVNEEAG